MSLLDYAQRESTILELPIESEIVDGLSSRNFVDSKPFECRSQESGQIFVYVIDVFEMRGQGIVDVN